MKGILIGLLFLLTGTVVFAQKYERSAGVRMGYMYGVFLDIQNEDLSSYRFMVNWKDKGRQFTAMKYFQKYKVDKLPSYLSFYYGFGAHVGYNRWDQYKRDTEFGYYWEEVTAPVFGLDGLIGLSYDLNYMPVSITCEVKPSFDLWGKNIFKAVPFDFALCLIYHF
jgi:hypothetical protein